MNTTQDNVMTVIKDLIIGTPLICTKTLAKIEYGEQTILLVAGKKYKVIDAVYTDDDTWQFYVVDEQGQPIWVDNYPYFQF